MVKEKISMDGITLDNIGAEIQKASKTIGRPKKNPYGDDKRLTLRMPGDLHRRLRYASVDLDKPLVEIVLDALVEHLDMIENISRRSGGAR